MLEKEKQMRDLIPYPSDYMERIDAVSLFHKLEKDVTILAGRINKIERRERVEKNRIIRGFYTNKLI